MRCCLRFENHTNELIMIVAHRYLLAPGGEAWPRPTDGDSVDAELLHLLMLVVVSLLPSKSNTPTMTSSRSKIKCNENVVDESSGLHYEIMDASMTGVP